MKYKLLDNLLISKTGKQMKKGEMSELKDVDPDVIKILLEMNKIKKARKKEVNND